MRHRRFITKALRGFGILMLASCSAFAAAAVVPHRPPHVVLALAITEGNHQTARAFAASTGPGYETAFPRPLVVRLVRRTTHTNVVKLRYACVERDCRFALAEEGDDVVRVDTRSYDVKVIDGRATLPLTLSTDRVPGVFHVRAFPSTAHENDAAATSVVFALTVR